jgi:hypothetical protein
MSKSQMRDTIQERFMQFHHDNPWILDRLLAMTNDLLKKGRKKCGMKMLWEVLRWNVETGEIVVTKDFKLNNIYTSRYARMIADLHPMYANVFEQRDLRTP